MSEWPGTLTRIDAIRIIENITDKDDPAWEWAVEDFYDEESDTFPTLYEVLQTLGVTEAEYKSATNAQNTNWPEVSDELYISQQARIDSLEAELSTLKAQREWVSVEEAELQPGEWVEAWHKVHECSITVTLGCGRETASGHPEWWEKTLTTSWPFEAMSHVRPLPPAPEGENE